MFTLQICSEIFNQVSFLTDFICICYKPVQKLQCSPKKCENKRNHTYEQTGRFVEWVKEDVRLTRDNIDRISVVVITHN